MIVNFIQGVSLEVYTREEQDLLDILDPELFGVKDLDLDLD